MNDHLQYRNKSINSLVQELNILGNRQVIIQPTLLYAVQTQQCHLIRRFQTKSQPHKQFFKIKQNDKKYFYHQIINDIQKRNLQEWLKNYKQKNYNCTLLMQNNIQNMLNVINCLQAQINQDSGVFCSIINQKNQVYDLYGQCQISHKQLIQNRKFYQLSKQQIISYFIQHQVKNEQKDFMNITLKNLTTFAQLNICLLPGEIFKSNCSSPYSLIKTQLFQILNYIKINPTKRYEHISHLITKRHPITNYLTKIYMGDSCNLILNYVTQEQETKIVGKFQLFDKLSIVDNLLRKVDKHMIEIGIKKQIKQKQTKQIINNEQQLSNTRYKNKNIQHYNHSNILIKQNYVSPIAKINNNTQNDLQEQNEQSQNEENQINQLQQKQFQFCRQLQRKTHKYSISPYQNQDQINSSRSNQSNKSNQSNENINLKIINKKTISKNLQINNYQNQKQINDLDKQTTIYQLKQTATKYSQSVNNEPQQIALLKAQHARQISQYHQTIQNLNKKIFILTKQKNLQELYKVHQRQIMVLELKIKQLRNDIIELTNEETSQKTNKAIIRKLTQQLKQYQSNTIKKISQGKILMLQKEVKQLKQKLNISQKARSHLSLQVDALTKRLKIRDSEIQKINQNEIEKYQCEELSVTEEELLEDIKKLVQAVKNQQRNSSDYLLRKISLILADMSKSRDIILECNDFLVQLMQILDEKLSKKVPQIVLDCNKFIRSFLIENLSIF